MSLVEDNYKQWICGKVGTVNLHRVSSIVRDIGEPCLHQSHIKVVTTVRTLKNLLLLVRRYIILEQCQHLLVLIITYCDFDNGGESWNTISSGFKYCYQVF